MKLYGLKFPKCKNKQGFMLFPSLNQRESFVERNKLLTVVRFEMVTLDEYL